MTKKKLYRGMLTLLAAGAVCTAAAAPQQGNEPMNLTADNLTYDTRTGLITAETNVRMEQGAGWIEGARATYNTKTEEGTIEGGVRAVRDDMNLSCERLIGIGQEHWQAFGSIHMVKAGRTFTGAQVDYYPAQNDYILAGSGGTHRMELVGNDAFFAQKLERGDYVLECVGSGSSNLLAFSGLDADSIMNAGFPGFAWGTGVGVLSLFLTVGGIVWLIVVNQKRKVILTALARY